LNWSVSAFPRVTLPGPDEWLQTLKASTELDGVRILECRVCSTETVQVLVSSQPPVSPAAIVASVKGRLQYLVRHRFPRAFHRNYLIESVGAANAETLDRYVAKQPRRHPMADARTQQRIQALQYHDPAVDLADIRTSSSGQFLHNLHLVLENAEGWHDCREESLFKMREMIVRSSSAKQYRLARVGLAANHIHIILGCDITDSPQTVALGFLNNLAFAREMRPIFKFSYYVGTFGRYDRQAIRNNL
jgi:REP element-mobilizing transposase RayT